MQNRLVLSFARLFLAIFALNAPLNAQTLWNEYRNAPNTHPNIPNCSFAGYGYGEVALPSTTTNTLPDGTVLPVVNVKTSFGAQGDGSTDDTAAIQNAIASVGTTYPGGAVLYFPNGTYVLSGQLKISRSKTILRGQSRTGTIFRFTKSLADLGIGSAWQWWGGLVSFETNWTQSWPSVSLRALPTRGTTTLQLNGASNFAAGDLMSIVVTEPTGGTSIAKHLLGDTPWADGWFANPAANADSNNIKGPNLYLNLMVEVASVNATAQTVTLKQPLRTDLRSGWNISFRKISGALQHVGLESVTLQMARNYQWFPQDHDISERGWNGVMMQNVWHGWLRDLTITDPDGLAVQLARSKNVTATGVTVNASGPTRERFHHAFMMGQAWDCLVENFNITAWPYHGLNIDYLSNGNVYSNGTLAHGTFDYHRMLPFENIFTQITLVNDGLNSGPSGGGPQMGARNAHWNINGLATGTSAVFEAPIMPRGALVGVQQLPNTPIDHSLYGATQMRRELSGFSAGRVPTPANLYAAQKALRLGQTIPGGGNASNPSFTVRPYDFQFSSGVLNAEIIGQDKWRLWESWAKEKNGLPMGQLVSDATYPGGATRVLVPQSGVECRAQRQNNQGWFFVPFQGTETDARIEFDAKNWAQVALSTGGGGSTLRFGPQWNGVAVAGAITALASRPASISSTDWVRYQARIDFSANSGAGALSIYYRDLSAGESTFTPVVGLQNLSLNGALTETYNWDTVTVFTNGNSAVDNILPNATLNGTVVNAPPVVSLSSPVNGATFVAGSTISLAADAFDSDGSIIRVQFFRGNTQIGQDTTSPYSVNWNNVAAGTYTLTARATSDNNAQTTSAPVTITVGSGSRSGSSG